MSEPILFDYQNKTEKEVFSLFRKGKRKVLTVVPGGGGKTIISGSMNKNYLLHQYKQHTNNKVAFFTHREELFNQTREKFLSFGNYTEPINADTTSIDPNATSFVCMVETFSRRSDSESFLNNFKGVKLGFIDEAHRADFNKILHHFDTANICGLTATPISSDKKQPMNQTWDVMLEAATTTMLQKLNSLEPKVGVVPCDCYQLEGIDRNKFKKKGEDYDEKTMSQDFRSKKQIQNTMQKYDELGKGMKGLCFNIDIEHNEDMHKEFLAAGVDSRMLHSDKKKFLGAPNASMMKNWRKDTLLWFKHTSGAMLNNVGILTTGFDEPSTELVMTNYSSLSISKVVQCHVRGARPYQYPNGEWKEFYRWLDFGKNCDYFNTDGNNDINWRGYFDSPYSTKNRQSAAAYKTCPECSSMVPVSARFCCGLKTDWLSQEQYECGYCFPLSVKEEDLVPRLMVKFFTDGIIVSDMIMYAKMNGYDIKGVFYKILDKVSELAKNKFGTFILSEQLDFLVDVAFKKIKELAKETQKRTWRDSVKKSLIEKLRKDGFILDIQEIGNAEVLNELKFNEQKFSLDI